MNNKIGEMREQVRHVIKRGYLPESFDNIFKLNSAKIHRDTDVGITDLMIDKFINNYGVIISFVNDVNLGEIRAYIDDESIPKAYIIIERIEDDDLNSLKITYKNICIFMGRDDEDA